MLVPLLLMRLGPATAVGDHRLPWWCLPEITARCAAGSRQEGAVAGEVAYCCSFSCLLSCTNPFFVIGHALE
jgi:hypothetical protein